MRAGRIGIIALWLLLGLVAGAHADPARDALATTFGAIDKALAGRDEAAFRARWHADGYATNLVGGSGNTGESMFRQGARKGWYPKPDLDAVVLRKDGAIAIVPCAIWSRAKAAAVDDIAVVLVRVGTGYAILGAGERRAEVEALADRWEHKRPLAPPAK